MDKKSIMIGERMEIKWRKHNQIVETESINVFLYKKWRKKDSLSPRRYHYLEY